MKDKKLDNFYLEDIDLDDIKTASVNFENKNNLVQSKENNLNEKKINDIIKELFSEDDFKDNKEDNQNINKEQIYEKNSKGIEYESLHDEIKNKDENLEENKIEENEENIKIDFTWIPLNKKWSNKLMSNKFMEKDCIGDGDCQFRSIETALTNAGSKMDSAKLRRIIGKYIYKIPNEQFYNILQNYRIEKENGEFKGTWNPFYVKTKRQFINNIIKSGFHFEGDSITLELLSKALGIDFIIFDNSYNITDLSDTDNLHNKLIILYYIKNKNGGHYKTIGLLSDNGKIQTIFKRSKLPKEIDILLDKHTFLLEHIKELYGGYNQKDVKLNKILYDIEEKLDLKLTKSDKRKIMVILRSWLQNLDYFKKINK